MRRADRLFRIVQRLRRRGIHTARALAAELEVSERTVYRDVRDLVRSGVPILGEAGVGYALPRGFDLPPLMFGEEELEALVLGARMVQSWADPALARAAGDALAKVEAVLPPALRERLLGAAVFAPPLGVPEDVARGLAELRRAVRERRKVRFAYVDKGGAASARTVWPLGLFFWGRTWSLAGPLRAAPGLPELPGRPGARPVRAGGALRAAGGAAAGGPAPPLPGGGGRRAALTRARSPRRGAGQRSLAGRADPPRRPRARRVLGCASHAPRPRQRAPPRRRPDLRRGGPPPHPPLRGAGAGGAHRPRRRGARGGPRARRLALRHRQRQERPLPRGLRLLLPVGPLPRGHRAGLPAPLRREIADQALAAERAGAREFSIVTSGTRVAREEELATIEEAVRLIREESGVEPCASLGLLRRPALERLKAAGLLHYHHNLETARSFFGNVCTTHTYDEQLETIRTARELGFQLCSGGILGMGESPEQRVEFAETVRELGVHCVPVNFLNPRPGTPMADLKAITPGECLAALAVFRLMMPAAHVFVMGGREVNLGPLQARIFEAGADGTMVGNYLTSAGGTPEQVSGMVRAQGLELRPPAGGRWGFTGEVGGRIGWNERATEERRRPALRVVR